MPPAKDRASLPVDIRCEDHADHLTRLDLAIFGEADRPGVLTRLATLQQSVDGISDRLKSAVPSLASVILMLLTVAVTAVSTYLAAHPSSPVPSAQAHPTH